MAEAVMRHKIKGSEFAGQIEVDSAGTRRFHIGEKPHRGTRSKLLENGISYDGIHARQITRDDFSIFDYIIAMDSQNHRDCSKIADEAGRARMYHLADFAENKIFSCGRDVPDPYFTGDFQQTFELVDCACDGLLEFLRKSVHH